MEIVFEVEFLLVNLVEGVLENLFSTDRNRMQPLPEFLLLVLYKILEDFGSQSKGYGVRHIDQDCVAYLCCYFIIR